MTFARDHELYSLRRIMAILTPMPPTQRQRLLRYIMDRIELLPQPKQPNSAAAEKADDLLIPPPP
jgi:hypothetical protein